MITIKLEDVENQIRLTVNGNGKQSSIIKEALFLIDHTNDIYSAVIDQLPSYAKLAVLLKALDNIESELKKEEHND